MIIIDVIIINICHNHRFSRYGIKELKKRVALFAYFYTFPDFHTFTLPSQSHITLFTFQGYSKVTDFMCSTVNCDDVFYALLPQVKARRGMRLRF